jgi:hypothetical protein
MCVKCVTAQIDGVMVRVQTNGKPLDIEQINALNALVRAAHKKLKSNDEGSTNRKRG